MMHCTYPTTARGLDIFSTLVVVGLLSRLALIHDILLVDTTDTLVRVALSMLLLDTRSVVLVNVLLSCVRVCHTSQYSVIAVDITRIWFSEVINFVVMIVTWRLRGAFCTD